MKLKMVINKDKLICFFLLFVVIVYYSQQALSIPSIIGQLSLLTIMLISLLYVHKVIFDKERSTKIFWVWLLFLIHNALYFIFTASYDDLNIFKVVLLNFLPFFPFYYFSKKNIITRKVLILFFLVMIPVFGMQILQSTTELKLETGKEDVIDNTIYLFIGLLPFLFLFKKKAIALLFSILILYFVVGSNKKAALIAWVFTFLLLLTKNIYIEKGKKSLKATLISAFSIAISLPLIYQFYITNEVLVQRVDMMLDGYSSSRDSIIEDAFGIWYNSDSLINYILGLGYNSTYKYTYHVSHNDWIDMLVSFGIVGFFLYLTLLVMLVADVFKKGWNKDKKVIYILFLVIVLLVSMTSRWYWSSFAYLNFLLLPYLLSTKKECL